MRFSLLALPFALVACSSSSTPPPEDSGAHDLSTAPDASVVDAGSSDSSLTPDTSLSDGSPSTDGASSDGATGADGSILPPYDAGDPFGDAGTLGDPAWSTLDVRTDSMCPALVPCGGDVVGTWDVSGGCVAVPIGTALSMCPGAMITSTTGMARGRVTFDGTMAHRVAQSNVEVDVFVPMICASFVGGCAGIATRLMAMAPDSTCVATAAGDCNCAARQTNTIDDTDGYTIVGDEIVSATLHKHWAYCITGSMLSYQDTTPTGPREPGIVDLTMDP